MLSKVDTLAEPSSSRPITIYPLLYRIWSKIPGVVHPEKLGMTMPMPPGICGGLPKRSAQDISYWTQYIIETA